MLNLAPHLSRSRSRSATTADVERDFGNQDRVGAAADARIEGDPPGITPHHLHDEDAFVRFRGRVQTIDSIGGERHSGVEPEAVGRADDVVVDRLGDADAWGCRTRRIVRDGERAVPADHHQRVEPHLVEHLDHAVAVGPQAVGGLDRIEKRIAAIGRAENRPAEPHDAADVVRCEHARSAALDQAIEAVFEADAFDAGVIGGLDHRADDGVQAGGIAAAGEDADAFEGSHCIEYSKSSSLNHDVVVNIRRRCPLETHQPTSLSAFPPPRPCRTRVTQAGPNDRYCVPMVDRGPLLGVLVVQTIAPRDCTPDDVRMVAAAASQLAPIVSDTRLAHEAQMQRERLRVVQVTMRTVQDIVNTCLNQF